MLPRFIIIAALTGIAAGRVPVFRMNRASIALSGAVLVVAAGGISLEAAFSSIDLETLALLFSMMVISINLRLSGFFRLAGDKIVGIAKTPKQLLILIILASGILSAFFLNDTVVLMFTPLVLSVILELERNPLPYLLALALSANIGSAATIIGNPQNMMIGIASGIDFFRFTGFLFIPSLAGLAIAFAVLLFAFPKEFRNCRLAAIPEKRRRIYRPLLVKSLISVLLFLSGILFQLPLPFAALIAAGFLLITRRLRPERVFTDIDWSLLVLFSGLFVIVSALRLDRGFQSLINSLIGHVASDSYLFSGGAGVLSNLVSNVPAVMLLRPGIEGLVDPEKAWLLLAMSTTFAGNLTLLGSIANLIVAESAKKKGVHISFLRYMTVGIPVTLLSAALGTLWIDWMY